MLCGRRVLIIAILLIAATVRAESPLEREARTEYATAQKLFDAAKYEEALTGYRRAFDLSHYPAILYRIALCLDLLNRRGEAADAYQKYLDADPASARREALEKKIAELRANAPPAPPPATVEAPPPVVAPPAVEKAAPPPRFVETRSGKATVALVGVAGVAIAVAVTTGAIVLTQKSDYNAGCATNASLCNDARALAITTDVLLPIGIVAGVTSIILYLVRPREHRFSLAPSSLTVRF